MAFRIILLTLVYSSWNILLSEGSAANQTNSTQNSTVMASSTPQTISPTTESSQSSVLTTPIISQSSSSVASSTISSSLTPIEPSSTIVQASSSLSGDLLQISANQGSSSGGQVRYVILPPENERRDYTLLGNTRLRWVRYLLDKSGPEFSVLKQFIEDHLYEIFKDVAGFLKTEVEEFIEEKVTFQAIIYTKSSEQVSKSELQALLNNYMLSEKSNDLKIYAFEIAPRFTEMPNDGNLPPAFSPPKGPDAENVDGIMSFLQGFGAMFALILVFGTIGFLKYKACKSKKVQDDDEKAWLKEAHVNEVAAE